MVAISQGVLDSLKAQPVPAVAIFQNADGSFQTKFTVPSTVALGLMMSVVIQLCQPASSKVVAA